MKADTPSGLSKKDEGGRHWSASVREGGARAHVARTGRRITLAVCCLCSTTLGLDPSVGREDSGDAERTEEFWKLDISEMFLEIESSFESRRVRSSPTFGRESFLLNRDVRVEEKFGLTLHGGSVDPDLLHWRLGMEIGLAQDRFRETVDRATRKESDSGLLLGYDFSLEAFPSQPVSISAYAREHRDRVPRRFLPSLVEDRRESGINVSAVEGNWKGEFGLSWWDVERTGNRLNVDDERLRQLRVFLDSEWRLSDAQRLRVHYDHQRDNNTYQGSGYGFETSRDEVRIEHDLEFGMGGRHRWDTYLRYNEEKGDLARDETEFNTRGTFRLTDRLRTTVRYGFYGLSEDAIDLRRHKLDWDAFYRPTDALSLTGNAYWLTERVDNDQETYEFGGSFDASYEKPTPWGVLGINVDFFGDRSRTVGSAGDRLVRDEGHALGDTRAVFLREPDVAPGSVIAHDASRTRIYFLGLDFITLPVGRRVMIRRVPSGRIADGETVFFDYRYRIPVGSRVDSYRTDVTVEHRFDSGITPYYGFELRRQNAHGSRGSFAAADNSERHRFGVRYEKPRWSLVGEAELFDDAYEPYDAYHLTLRTSVLRDAVHSADAVLDVSRYNFTGAFDNRDVWWVDLDFSDRIWFDSSLSASFGAGYRYESDSLDGETNGVDLAGGLRWQRGQLDVDLMAEYDVLTIGDNSDRGFGVWLTIRRDLTHLVRKRRGTTW